MDDCVIRAVRASEMAEVRQLLDSVFVKPERKGTMYDWTPTLLDDSNARNVYAAFVNGRIVSTAGFKIVEMRYRGVRMRSALIGSVATLADHRGNGHSKRVLEELGVGMSRADVDFSALWTASPDFYAKYGWKSLGVQDTYTIAVAEHTAADGVRPFAGEFAVLRYLRDQSGYLHTERTDEDTRLLLDHSPVRRAVISERGYAIYEKVPTCINVLESGGDVLVLPSLFAATANIEGERVCRMQIAPDDPRPAVLERAGFELTSRRRTAAMFRLERRSALISRLASAGFSVENDAAEEQIFGTPEHTDAPLVGMSINWLDRV